jgi:excisionase family DNA binding protein
VSAVLTPDQLAERWSVPKAHIYRLAREGRIPVVRLGRYRRFRLDEIERFELGFRVPGDNPKEVAGRR